MLRGCRLIAVGMPYGCRLAAVWLPQVSLQCLQCDRFVASLEQRSRKRLELEVDPALRVELDAVGENQFQVSACGEG